MSVFSQTLPLSSAMPLRRLLLKSVFACRPLLSVPAGFVFAREKLRVGVFQPVTAAREGGGFSHLLLRFQYRTVWSAAGEWQVEAMRALPELLVCVGSCGFGSWLWWCCGVGVNLASRSSGCSWGLYYATVFSHQWLNRHVAYPGAVSNLLMVMLPLKLLQSMEQCSVSFSSSCSVSAFLFLHSRIRGPFRLFWLNRHVAYPGAVSNLLMVMLPLKLLQVMEHCSVSFSSSCPVSAFLFLRCRIRSPFGLFVCGRFSVVEAVQPVIEQFSKVQLMGTQNYPHQESALHSEVEALRWAMESMFQHSTYQSFGTGCKNLITIIKEPHALPNFSIELERIDILQICFSDFKIVHIPRAQNQISDSLVRTAKSFYRDLCVIGCSIPA
ncbi:hypothetical protein DY000_02030979 [Brassica cretica]|uniref:RNase H type-1 domain-containing protein n=1 Tax=Brassica cretica TaxID=69181 RepID=A0ABQ7DRI6_BRACR|nr:hypothetical protein DY000_02030979 [Brassica cretica]